MKLLAGTVAFVAEDLVPDLRARALDVLERVVLRLCENDEDLRERLLTELARMHGAKLEIWSKR